MPANRPGPSRLRRAAGALTEFLRTESAGGVVLLLAVAAALVWANSARAGSYEGFWSRPTTLRSGGVALPGDLRHWVNDGLMTLFFFVAGLEIKRELVRGELREPRRAMLPLVGAAGGVILPAVVYLVVAGAHPTTARGWGVPIATDIAFAVGVLALLGRRAPASLRLFVLALAIVDDIVAIAVIGLAYPSGVRPGALGIAAAVLGLVLLLRLARRWSTPVAMLLGVGVWLALLQSGVEATVGGVALALLVPVASAEGRQPPGERLEHSLHPWASYAVVPLFALANAGLSFDRASLAVALRSRVSLGVFLGLALGKVLGISTFCWAARRLGLAAMPRGTSRAQFVGAAAVAGIGFTVSLFVAGLAFDNAALVEQAKAGVFAGSLVSACVGAAILRLAGRDAAVRRDPFG